MAPEQASGGNSQLTTATDVYCLGAILYHLLTGRPPFHGASAVETMRRVVDSAPDPPERLNSLVDRDLATICLKCLSKDPARRYSSARALADDLDRWRNNETILARPATRMEHFSRWCRRRPALAGLTAAVFLLLAIVAVVSTSAVIRVNRAMGAVVASQRNATDKLRESYLAQARAQRWSGRPGRRFESLRALTNAAAIRNGVDLRNEAVACLALTDLDPIPGWPRRMPQGEKIVIDWPRDRYARTETGGAVTFRDLNTDEQLFQLPGKDKNITDIRDVTTDGRWLPVVYGDKGLDVWDLRRREIALHLEFDFADYAFSPDFNKLALSTFETNFVVIELENPARRVTNSLPVIAWGSRWSPNGTTIASYGTREIFFFDTASGRVTLHVPFSSQPFYLAWHPDGVRLAWGGQDKHVHILDSRSGLELSTFKGHLGTVTSVAFSPDGKMLASDSWDGRLRLWDVLTGAEIINTPEGPEGIHFSPDGKHLAVYSWEQSRAALFNVGVNEVELSLPGNAPRYLDALLFGPSGGWLASSQDDDLCFWDPESGRQLALVPKGPCSSLQLYWQETTIFGWTTNRFYRVPIHATENSFSVGEPGRFKPVIPKEFVGLENSGILTNFTDKHTPERSSASTDGETVAVTYRYRCFIFDMAHGALQAVTDRQTEMKYVSVSPDGRWVATGAWHTNNVMIWNVRTGAKETEIRTGISPTVAFSPDGKWLVTGTGQEYVFWRAGGWTPAHRIVRANLSDLPGPMAFSMDGRVLALAHERGNIRLVVPETGELLAEINPIPDNEIVTLAFNHDASLLAVSRAGLTAQIWKLKRMREQLSALHLDWSP